MTPEGRVKAAVKKILKDRDIWFYMPVQNGMGLVGIPDFICCYKGHFLAIETKAPGKVENLTPNQKNVIKSLRDAGGRAIIIDDAAQLERYLDVLDVLIMME